MKLTSKSQLKTPVLLLVFNRPDRARTVLDAIRKVQPAHLYISADGPRAGKSGEAALCAEARAIIREIDWACEIHTNFLDVNLGCANAVSQGINWFFTQVEQGIILEDDCLPNASFFWFCDKLLEHYKDDHRVMHISGNNFQDGQVRGDASYYFSRESLIWGWATWRRAWQHFDLSTASLADFEKQDGMSDLYQDLLIKKYKLYHLKKIQKMSKKTSWAFPWSYAVYTQGGLCVTPNVNLVSNIGFGTESVHAKNRWDRYSCMETHEIEELTHPRFMIPDTRADVYTLKNHLRYSIKGIFEKMIVKLVFDKMTKIFERFLTK